jgi:hypothetical protein
LTTIETYPINYQPIATDNAKTMYLASICANGDRFGCGMTAS